MRRQVSNMNRSNVRNRRGGSNFLIIILILAVVLMVVLLIIPIGALITLLAASVVGVGIGFIFSAKKTEITPEDELFKSTIEQFQVPETRNALLKFAIEASHKIKPVSAAKAMFNGEAKRQRWLNDVWASKCRKVYTTARFAMKDDAGSLAQITQLMNEAGIKV